MSTLTDSQIDDERKLKADPFDIPREEHDDWEEEGYRTVSRAAVTSVALAVLGLVAFWAPLFVILPFLAVCFGFIGLSSIRRYPDELVGKKAAWLGILLGGLVFASSVGWHSFVYVTEVPEGFSRVRFYELKPSSRSNLLFTERAEELDGQQVFIKGYVRPGNESRNLKKFVLTGDFGDCCFGGNPKISEVIGITILSDQTVDYDFRYRTIMGTFKLNKNPKAIDEKDVPHIIYEIECTEVR
jgi:hypothetical protein